MLLKLYATYDNSQAHHYAQTLIVVNLTLVNLIRFLIITSLTVWEFRAQTADIFFYVSSTSLYLLELGS